MDVRLKRNKIKMILDKLTTSGQQRVKWKLTRWTLGGAARTSSINRIDIAPLVEIKLRKVILRLTL
jgi:hypothetical protein